MTDYVLNSPSRPAFLAAARALGFADADGNVQITGVTSDGGNYFINEVGVVSAPTGKQVEQTTTYTYTTQEPTGNMLTGSRDVWVSDNNPDDPEAGHMETQSYQYEETAPVEKTDTKTELVDEMTQLPGHWARIRVNNGLPIPVVPPGFTLYPPEKYLEDGITVDETYVQPPYGQIA